ncbi:histone H1C-like [Ctenocephalides felis]|uniref:histone H1C-like n=1 Tax=Ctenocephalides felis TaxID=7515 RepID=UPI000E6E10A7|nr:histone H1C-like [Ctenocephalides felis]
MSDNALSTSPAATAAPATASPKKGKTAAVKKPRVKPSHPPTSEMVNNAIKSLKERGGSSLQAIKKYMSANYKIDAEKMSTFIKKYLKSAVQAGTLIQTKGKGASGSFKLAANAKQSGGESVFRLKSRTAKTPGKSQRRQKSKGAAKPASSLKRSLEGIRSGHIKKVVGET